MRKYTEADFKEMTGCLPERDDLVRLNCDKAGEVGHMSCGYCEHHNLPQYICACYLKSKLGDRHE